ncbi:MAG TPA: type III-B CRISPR module-associated Cmr3 family protein [Trebonia sp.]
MTAGTTSAWLAFTPRDTVFVRDGRSFDAASDAVADTVRPSPTTIAGAVGAAFGENPVAVRGPVLAYRDGDGTWRPYFPVPADLVVTTDGTERVYRMTPGLDEDPGAAGQTDLTYASPANGGLRFLLPPQEAGAVKALDGWIPASILAGYLAGRLPGRDGMARKDLQIADPLVPERRVGLAREGRAAREGYLYQATHLRPRDGWGFLAEYDVPDEWGVRASEQVPFGGRGRVADIGAADVHWPDAADLEPPAAIGRQVLVYLATAAVWPGGWRLPVPDGARLIAAATGEPEPAATVKRDQGQWRASRVLRWAVPAGSVYLLEFTDAAAGARWARERNGAALDRGVADDPDVVRTAGFGVVLTGAWT